MEVAHHWYLHIERAELDAVARLVVATFRGDENTRFNADETVDAELVASTYLPREDGIGTGIVVNV